MKLTIEQVSSKATLLAIDLENRQAQVSDLSDLDFPEIEGSKGLILSGFPQWAVLTVALEYKNKSNWIAVIDPKLGETKSCVICWSLSEEYQRGNIVALNDLNLNSSAPVTQ